MDEETNRHTGSGLGAVPRLDRLVAELVARSTWRDHTLDVVAAYNREMQEVLNGRTDEELSAEEVASVAEIRRRFRAPLIDVVRAQRDAEVISPEMAFFYIAWTTDPDVEERINASRTEGELAEIISAMGSIERTHGLGAEQSWKVNEGPPEWQQLNRRYNQVSDAIRAEVLREYGEENMARLLESEPITYRRIFETGRAEWLRGTLGTGL